jgi:hypothetical protein
LNEVRILSILKVLIKKKWFLLTADRLFFENLYRYWHNIRPRVSHKVGIIHDVNEVFQIALGKVGQSFIPSPEYQDIEPLDKQADECKNPIDPENNADNYPVCYTDKEFKTACVMLKGEELSW